MILRNFRRLMIAIAVVGLSCSARQIFAIEFSQFYIQKLHNPSSSTELKYEVWILICFRFSCLRLLSSVAYFKIMFYGQIFVWKNNRTKDSVFHVLHVSNILHRASGSFIINFYRSPEFRPNDVKWKWITAASWFRNVMESTETSPTILKLWW